MGKQNLHPQIRRKRDHVRDYEYLIITVSPREPASEVRTLLGDYAEYGKWELERTRLYIGGVSKFWLRRRVMKVQRTA